VRAFISRYPRIRENLHERTGAYVFIVDDDPSVLKPLRANEFRRTKCGHIRFAARVLEHHDQNALGCLVLDVAMPHINGLELHQMLVAQGCDLPVIFLTGHETFR